MTERPALVRLRSALCLAGLLASASVFAQPTDEAAYQERHRAERARIAAERVRVEQRFAEEQAACQNRFAVTGCVESSRARQQQALAELQRQQNLLADEERRRRAGERLQKLDDKAAAHARQPAMPPPAPAPEREGRTPPSPPSGRLPGEKTAAERDIEREARYEAEMRERLQKNADNAARRAEQAQQAGDEQKRFDAKQREAAEYKARVLRRQADKPTTAQPLPTPPS